MSKGKVSIVAVISSKNRALGHKGGLLWHIPGDLPRFKKLTMGHPIIMGRKTHESIGRPLPGRTNIVLKKGPLGFWAPKWVRSLAEAMEEAGKADGNDEIFVIGGGEIYKLALPYTGKLYLTIVDDEPEADTFFPEYAHDFRIIKREEGDPVGPPPFHYETLERARSLAS